MKSIYMKLQDTLLTVTILTKKRIYKEDARKGDMTKHEMRNIINEGFDYFQQYMWMKLQSAEFEDVEMIEESINVFKHYMLNKIDE